MKLKEAYRELVLSLNSLYDSNEASSIARYVFEDLGIKTVSVYSDPHAQLSPENQNKLKEFTRRLLRGEPVQYVLGYTWFREHKFLVNRNCLIPRQETEELVELVLKETHETGRLLDIGTGSGCIALSIKRENPGWQVQGTELFSETLKLARENAKHQQLDVKFIQDDILKPDDSKFPEPYSLIVSNPPYVKNSERSLMHANVLDYEPPGALFVPDEDPLLYYRAIRDFSLRKLAKKGKLFLEINESLGKETSELFSSEDFHGIQIIKDIHNKSRFIKAIRNE